MAMLSIDGTPVPKINILYDLLIKQNKGVLFVGESNFTFTVAFAALRKHEKFSTDLVEQLAQLDIDPKDVNMDWKRIKTSRYESVSDSEPALDLTKVKLRCVDDSRTYEKPFPDPLAVLRAIIDLADVPATRIGYGIDPCAISPALVSGCDVVWLQCPWIQPRTDVAQLLQKFLLKNAKNIPCGTYVCIGIINKFPYCKAYEISDLLAENDTPISRQYKFVGADGNLVNKMLVFGYHHECYQLGQGRHPKDIHSENKDSHVTLVFQRKEGK